jgi:hypothetical protein
MSKLSAAAERQVGSTEPKKVLPSQFMRGLRPEYYSDTQYRASYALDANVLEYCLEAITPHNQTHDFELFARKLCERAICPNLRPQTGPEGGGDSKADSETYPVSDEISRTYVGQANGGRERWAFAFSAKKTWAEKARSDVKGIVDTGRSYDKIICVTSRFAKAKDRARVEDELTKKHGVPVTIHDRSWIVKEIVEADRKDLAYNYLGIGEVNTDPLRLGPTDYSRTQQLADIEKSLADPEAFRGMETQLVTEALVAAKLSRGLERPRTEIDGQFVRAIRLADAEGTYRQKLEARYEQIWTAFWWFDDFRLLNESYSDFEARAVKSRHAKNLEFLCNLLQILVNSVVHDHMSRSECHLDERTATLRAALEPMAADTERPNNSLEAQTSLLIIQLNGVFIERRRDDLPAIWQGFGNILDRAKGLGEYDADRLAKMIDLAGQIAGNDPAYNDLVEKLAAFVEDRKSEGEGALILLRRAEKLDLSDHFDIIRLLGRAAVRLTKKEYADHLTKAVQLLTQAYRSAGLVWAARASCIFVAAAIVMEGEEDSYLPVGIIPAMKNWGWLALQLGHLPDLLYAIQFLNGAHQGLPLDDESKKRVEEDIRELELALGSKFLNLNDAELQKLEKLPDLLEAMGLFLARAALLYTLGYLDTLREDGSIPKEETDEGVVRMFTMLASQPVARETPSVMILNEPGTQTLATTILGMTVEISGPGTTEGIMVAEAVLGSLEAFFATALEDDIMPHTERLHIDLVEGIDGSEPSFEINAMDMKATLTWPTTLSPTRFDQQGEVQKALAIAASQILGTTCMMKSAEQLLDKLFVDEAVQNRMAMIAVAANSYSRVTSKSLSRLSDWQEVARTSYPMRLPRPKLTLLDLEEQQDVDGGDEANSQSAAGADARTLEPPRAKDHQGLTVRSIVDVHAWDRAGWKGTLYAEFPDDRPPCMAFMFENREGAVKIFERWRERFGDRDVSEEIYLAIVRNLPKENPYHYCVIVTSKYPDIDGSQPKKLFVIPSRSMTMEPNSDVNLERFLSSYRRFGAYYLLPAVFGGTGEPELLFELGIWKRNLTVKPASEVGEYDVETIALRRPR